MANGASAVHVNPHLNPLIGLQDRQESRALQLALPSHPRQKATRVCPPTRQWCPRTRTPTPLIIPTTQQVLVDNKS